MSVRGPSSVPRLPFPARGSDVPPLAGIRLSDCSVAPKPAVESSQGRCGSGWSPPVPWTASVHGPALTF
eukprot:9692032-Lingulodinium_polyedra.AAC.1